MAGPSDPSDQSLPSRTTAKAVVADGLSFALNGDNVSYRFHVDHSSLDLVCDHFGGPVTEDAVIAVPVRGGWSTQGHLRREFPDLGRGDFRIPAVRIKQPQGITVCQFQYLSYAIMDGKPELPGLPSTYGRQEEVKTLVIYLSDHHSSVSADLSYSIFPEHDAIVRSVTITNRGKEDVIIEKLASFSIDFPYNDYEMLQLQGEWSKECTRIRRKVDYGLQGFGSATGYSSHYNNPFLALVEPSTTESHGDAWGFSLVYSGSFSVEVERSPQGLTRALLGTSPDQFSWPLRPGKSFTSPECVSIFSSAGIGGMSRNFHRLYRQNLMHSNWVNKTRPTVLNSWEGLYFNFDGEIIYKMAQSSAELGVKIFVLDDGWFGDKYPRVNDQAGLGDWVVNRKRFPDGLDALAERITRLQPANSDTKLKFGLWFEPEMVNKKSKLFDEHPDWVLHAGDYPQTECRHQLVLNAALPEVQDFIIESVAHILETVPYISYVKWDNNRGIHETPNTQTSHANTLGLYRILKELTARFPDILWEGCASGGGRFDPGILHYFPQIWTSDNTDGLDRIQIQFGTSLVYPPSAMSAHISHVPNDITKRTTSMRFRAHVAMMAGSFGLEVDPDALPENDRAQIPELIALAERVNPIVIEGDMWRLSLPDVSNYPAALFVSKDGQQAVLFAFQVRLKTVHSFPTLRLQGLDSSGMYKLDGKETYSGATLMNGGIQYSFKTDYDSRVVFLEKQ